MPTMQPLIARCALARRKKLEITNGCRSERIINERGLTLPPLPVTVNVSIYARRTSGLKDHAGVFGMIQLYIPVINYNTCCIISDISF